ncbi:hypothetical protein HX004_13880 [Myroides sp. 1354]|uniref:hypothetical protein n=1 Tax=unclassified Myroides TaxID=2642485 RepID=UPI002575F816|nr:MULTISPECIES: hypothetical protein [unclassified Myroides]MDM1044445.1 hypothetical protein [Myroides sp. R163-1]MDM1056853.1 hypothetical protein [Myroides sp. 1354]MDM1069876.1 hypothetical protein [Myroides sp. 1372]
MNPYKLKITDTYTLVNQTKMYDLDQCFAFIQERGKAIFGYHFTLTSRQKELFYKLIAYAIDDQKVMASLKLSSNKGLLLMGEEGSGKTAFMRLTQSFYPHKKNYDIKVSRLLAQDFSCKGYEIFTPIFAPNAKCICLDNVGKEFIAKHYGTSCDVIYDIVEHFYEQRYDASYPKLHITTALSPTELEKRYGKKFRNMVKELFNVIVCER